MTINSAIDFNGKTIKHGDRVVYMRGVRTGSSTTRKCLFRGRVLDFTPKMVHIINELGYRDTVPVCHVVKVDW